MVHDTLNLAALIGSRICHDLISPIGAIRNGLELIELTRNADGPEMQLISDSCASASSRIRFFRLAFGYAGDREALALRDILATLEGITQGARVEVDWKATGNQPRFEVQLAFLAYLCVESALPHGGAVAITRSGDRWTVRVTRGNPVLVDAHWTAITDRDAASALQPAQVQFALLPLLVADRGRTVVVARDEGLSVTV